MQDFITLGPVPSDEACAQMGDEHYASRARAECKRFIALLRQTFGPEPSGAWLSTKAFDHDFGTYYEVVCYFNTDAPESVNYAYRCEDEAPTTWGREGDALERCPECKGELEQGNAVQLFSFMATDGYLCKACKVIYAHDRTVLARLT
jgi:hypothetical protein